MDEKTKRVLGIASGDLLLAPTPFDAWAKDAGIALDEFIEILKREVGRGVVRRFGAVGVPAALGMRAGAMVAWEVRPADADRAGEIMARSRAVSHCYLRETTPGWPYTLYAMVHAEDDGTLNEIIERIARDTGIVSYTVLRTIREFKKTSPDYLGGNDDGG